MPVGYTCPRTGKVHYGATLQQAVDICNAECTKSKQVVINESFAKPKENVKVIEKPTFAEVDDEDEKPKGLKKIFGKKK